MTGWLDVWMMSFFHRIEENLRSDILKVLDHSIHDTTLCYIPHIVFGYTHDVIALLYLRKVYVIPCIAFF